MKQVPLIFIIGYGNPGRQDDGLGPQIVAEIERSGYENVTAETDYQLGIEYAYELSRHEVVLFVDADVSAPEPFHVKKIQARYVSSFTSHILPPESVLAICRDTYGHVPECWLIGIRGYEFGLSEVMTHRAEENGSRALEFIKLLINNWKGEVMAAGDLEKTILIIDDDPDIRASTRIVLESVGFNVGEAADGAEGLKVIQRVNPDAVLIDLMMETVDAGSKVSTQLKGSGYEGPIYLLSAVGDAVRYNVDAKELGLAGIFQKPIDHNMLLTTLKTKLKIK